TSGAVAAEVHVNSTRLHDRCGGCITVRGDAVAGLGHVEHFDVMYDLARFAIDADGVQLLAVDSRRCHPNLVPPDDGRGPALVVDGNFPFDVVGFAPAARQANRIRMTVRRRAAELGPIFASRCIRGCEPNDDERAKKVDDSERAVSRDVKGKTTFRNSRTHRLTRASLYESLNGKSEKSPTSSVLAYEICDSQGYFRR